jgi:hypothetical protein
MSVYYSDRTVQKVFDKWKGTPFVLKILMIRTYQLVQSVLNDLYTYVETERGRLPNASLEFLGGVCELSGRWDGCIYIRSPVFLFFVKGSKPPE